jgi:hypothetical protein
MLMKKNPGAGPAADGQCRWSGLCPSHGKAAGARTTRSPPGFEFFAGNYFRFKLFLSLVGNNRHHGFFSGATFAA